LELNPWDQYQLLNQPLMSLPPQLPQDSPYSSIFDQLNAQAGPRGATFLGRQIQPTDTDTAALLQRPAMADLESGSRIKYYTDPFQATMGIGYGQELQGIRQLSQRPPPSIEDLNLTPQERFRWLIHLNNLKNPVVNEDGSISTLRQLSFEQDGRTYNVPTVWNAAVHSPEESIRRARAIGIFKYPSYPSRDEAEARYQQMHKYMER